MWQRVRRHSWAVFIMTTALVTMSVGTLGAALVSHHGRLPPITLRSLPGAHSAQAPVSSPLPTPNPAATLTPLPAGNDWTQYRFDVAGTGNNPEGIISAAEGATLGTRWVASDFNAHPFESTPAELGGVIYVTNNNSLLAVDLRTGATLWHFEDAPMPAFVQSVISSSVAVDPQTKIAYYGTPDARVYAVDTTHHTLVWQTQLGDPSAGAYIWSSPLLVHGLLYIGLASHNDTPCVRGAVFALDLATGTTHWTHYMVPEGVLGGAVWSSLTADPDAQEVIATTGNPGPCTEPGTSVAQEDSVVAMNWDSGDTLWNYQALTYDDCDCDFGEGATIFTFQGTEYVVAGNKAGMMYALVPPTTLGGAPTVAWSLQITASGYLGSGGIYEPPTYADGMIFVAGGPTLDGSCSGGALWALSATDGSVLWRQCTEGQVVGPSAISQDLLFVPEQGALVAYQTTTGKAIWQANEQGATYGGVAIARGYVLSGTTSGGLYCYTLPDGS